MGDRIAGKKERAILIIIDPLNSPKYAFIFTFWLVSEKLVFKLFLLVVHMSPL